MKNDGAPNSNALEHITKSTVYHLEMHKFSLDINVSHLCIVVEYLTAWCQLDDDTSMVYIRVREMESLITLSGRG